MDIALGKAKTNQEWWHHHVGRLQKQAEPLAKIQPTQVYEKSGFWPVLKLVFMKYALGFYVPILAKQREIGAWGSLHFIDLCAGSGITRLQAKSKSASIQVTGSALIGAADGRFDHYHFVEPNPKSSSALTERLESLLPADKFTVYPTTAGVALPHIVSALGNWRNPHYAAFVDPEGLTEITLPRLAPLMNFGRGDFLFNYQYMGVRRVPPEHADAFFGDSGWRTLGNEEELRPYFLDRLKAFGRPKATVVPVVAGKGSGRYAYDMVYCSAETLGGNPWLSSLQDEVERRMEGIDGTSLENMILGGQQMLF